jgi:hypothetical protein
LLFLTWLWVYLPKLDSLKRRVHGRCCTAGTRIVAQAAFVCLRRVKSVLWCVCLVLVSARNGYSQINPIPTVTIQATDPFATWQGDPGTFTLFRDGPTNRLNWTSICTNQVVNGSIDFINADAPSDQSRFYRTVPETNPPPY